MPVRRQPIDDEAAAFEDVYKRIRKIDDTLRNRSVPPGYHVTIVGDDLVFTRESDGATSTLVFT